MGQMLLAILSIGLLMIVHESGHFLAARRFGMRVKTFSIGLGPRIFHHKSEKSGTTYQVALIPFLAYVQIAGMNPFDPEDDPEDAEGYAKASWWGRFVTIFAGPLANYVFSSVLLFLVFALSGDAIPVGKTTIEIQDKSGAAASAGLLDGDRIVSVQNAPIREWKDLRAAVSGSGGKEIDIEIERKAGAPTLHLKATPKVDEKGRGLLGVAQPYERVRIPLPEAGKRAMIAPAIVVYEQVHGVVLMMIGAVKPDISGPVGMFREVKKSFEQDLTQGFMFVAVISASIAAFNMLPFPALDGGRLLFLAFEAISRRRANQKTEQTIHAIGLMVLLGLVGLVTVRELLPKGATTDAPVAPAAAPSAPKAGTPEQGGPAK